MFVSLSVPPLCDREIICTLRNLSERPRSKIIHHRAATGRLVVILLLFLLAFSSSLKPQTQQRRQSIFNSTLCLIHV